MDPLISVIVPVYKVEEYLPRCIESIINQTYKNLEIILINDGSPDNCGRICDEYAKKDDRIVVIHQENAGVAAARKPGIRCAKGEYIGFVDSDDWIEPEMYEHMMEKMLAYDVDFVAVGMVTENDDKSAKYANNERYICKSLQMEESCRVFFSYLDENFASIALWNKLFKNSIPQEYYLPIPDDITSLTDSFCTYSYLPHIGSIYISNRIFYHYNIQNVAAVTRNFNFSNMYDLLKFYEFQRKTHEMLLDKKFIMDKVDMFYVKLLFGFAPDSVKKKSSFPFFPGEVLIPFKRIVIYGAGTVGRAYYGQFNNLPQVEIVAFVDLYKANEYVDGVKVESIESLLFKEYDTIIIAIMDRKLSIEISDNLVTNYGISREKIVWEQPISAVDKLLNMFSLK